MKVLATFYALLERYFFDRRIRTSTVVMMTMSKEPHMQFTKLHVRNCAYLNLLKNTPGHRAYYNETNNSPVRKMPEMFYKKKNMLITVKTITNPV